MTEEELKKLEGKIIKKVIASDIYGEKETDIKDYVDYEEQGDFEKLQFYTSDGILTMIGEPGCCCYTVFVKEITGSIANIIESPIIKTNFFEQTTEAPEEQCTYITIGSVKGDVVIAFEGGNHYYTSGVTITFEPYLN